MLTRTAIKMLEQADAMGATARAGVLGAFAAGRGYAADADYSPRSWLIHQAGITRGAAAMHMAWVPDPADAGGHEVACAGVAVVHGRRDLRARRRHRDAEPGQEPGDVELEVGVMAPPARRGRPGRRSPW